MASEKESSVRRCDKSQNRYYIAKNREFTKKDIELYNIDIESKDYITWRE